MELSPFHSPSILLCLRASEGKATAAMSLANRIPRVYVDPSAQQLGCFAKRP